MSIPRLRQVAALEKRMQPLIERKKALRRNAASELRVAASHAAAIAFISRYGGPQIGEPLARAFERVENSEAWKECCRMFPTALGQVRHEFQPKHLTRIGMPIRHGLNRFFQDKTKEISSSESSKQRHHG